MRILLACFCVGMLLLCACFASAGPFGFFGRGARQQDYSSGNCVAARPAQPDQGGWQEPAAVKVTPSHWRRLDPQGPGNFPLPSEKAEVGLRPSVYYPPPALGTRQPVPR
jgi:hypothetical protein